MGYLKYKDFQTSRPRHAQEKGARGTKFGLDVGPGIL